MEHARQDALSGAGLPQQQHGEIAGRHAPHRRLELAHDRGATNEAPEGPVRRQLLAALLGLVTEARLRGVEAVALAEDAAAGLQRLEDGARHRQQRVQELSMLVGEMPALLVLEMN